MTEGGRNQREKCVGELQKDENVWALDLEELEHKQMQLAGPKQQLRSVQWVELRGALAAMKGCRGGRSRQGKEGKGVGRFPTCASLAS